ncbi:hypothetical protein MTR67_021570, partial [Solanum verrucosum]
VQFESTFFISRNRKIGVLHSLRFVASQSFIKFIFGNC